MTFWSVFLVGVVAFAAESTTEIKVDQAGYPSDAPKLAIVSAKSAATSFQVTDARTGKAAFAGKLSTALADADSGDSVQTADFSGLRKAGTYYVEVAGVGRSWDFAIGPDVFQRAFYLAMRSYYGQRCGTAVDLGPEFPGFEHEACHLAGAYHASSGKTGEHVSAKGWHDAGDYGRYVVNSGITTGTLLWTYEMFAPRVRRVGLKIPESGNGTPDILNEIRWNLEWMLSMQDADGGVWHKQTSERFCGFVMPEKDSLVSYVIGTGSEPFKSACATADFAAVMAIAGRVYKPFDAAFAGKATDAAALAWKWLEAHPDVLFRNPPGVSTGAYGDGNCGDERLWASVELWRTTGQDAYNAYFMANFDRFRNSVRAAGPPGWNSVGALALWSYALGKGKDTEAVSAITAHSVKAADEIVARTNANGYRVSLTSKEYIWGSNGVVANYGMQLLIANALQADRRYVDAALDNVHYLLGRNTFSLSFVTAVGSNSYKHPHHRPSGADGIEDPWPGLLSGGPNRAKQDPAMRKLPDGLPPAKMFLDEQESYATNEIAINWNAPLVFVLGGLIAAR